MLYKEVPHMQIKEATPAEAPFIRVYFSTTLSGIIEVKPGGSDEVLGRAKLSKDHITGEVIAPNVKAEEKRAHIAAGVDGAQQRQVGTPAKHLMGIRRHAPAEH